MGKMTKHPIIIGSDPRLMRICCMVVKSFDGMARVKLHNLLVVAKSCCLVFCWAAFSLRVLMLV